MDGKKQSKLEITVRIGWVEYIFYSAAQAACFMVAARDHILPEDNDIINITMECRFIEDTEEDTENEE